MKIARCLPFAAAAAAMAGSFCLRQKKKRRQAALKNYGDKFYEYFQLLNRWMISDYEGKRVADFFHQEKIKRIAVYGMGELANRLTEALEGSGIQILYGIDRDVCCTNARIAEIYYPDDKLPEVDAVVITPFLSADAIKRDLAKTCPYKMISLDHMIYSL